MGSHCSERSAHLPKGWTKHVKSALIPSVSLAATALSLAHGRTSASKSARNQVPGFVTVVARKGKVVHFEALGSMDVERKKAMRPDTILRGARYTLAQKPRRWSRAKAKWEMSA